eukprot:5262057-Alexandrium_andersonii.AAC.1
MPSLSTHGRLIPESEHVPQASSRADLPFSALPGAGRARGLHDLLGHADLLVLLGLAALRSGA